MKTADEVLAGALALMQRGWCQHWFARAADGGRVPASNAMATQWCALGALYRAADLTVEDDVLQPDHPMLPVLCQSMQRLVNVIVPDRELPVSQLSASDLRGYVSQWNDRPMRKLLDIVRAFEEARRVVLTAN